MIFERWLWNLRCCGDCLAAFGSLFLRIWLCFSACSFLQGLGTTLCGCGRLPRSGSWRCSQVTRTVLLQLRLTGAESTWRQVGREARRAAALPCLSCCWRDTFCVALFELHCSCGLFFYCSPAFHIYFDSIACCFCVIFAFCLIFFIFTHMMRCWFHCFHCYYCCCASEAVVWSRFSCWLRCLQWFWYVSEYSWSSWPTDDHDGDFELNHLVCISSASVILQLFEDLFLFVMFASPVTCLDACSCEHTSAPSCSRWTAAKDVFLITFCMNQNLICLPSWCFFFGFAVVGLKCCCRGWLKSANLRFGVLWKPANASGWLLLRISRVHQLHCCCCCCWFCCCGWCCQW